MKILVKNLLYTVLFLLLGFCFLFHAEKTADFAYIGLQTWFESMIVSLFPFMVLMNLLIDMGLTGSFVKPFHFLLKPFFRNTENATFVILFGFLCGFPLGAKSAVSLYQKGQISKENAQYLLSFANNIGPSYLLGFVLPEICPEISVPTALFCFLGIPFLYGIVLRNTIYRKILDREYNFNKEKKNIPIEARENTIKESKRVLSALPCAINGALSQITALGGYMIVFNALRIIPHSFFSANSGLYILAQSVLEISGGLLCVRQMIPEGLLRLAAIAGVYSFNGFCCHFQTFSLMQETPLSAKKYMLHKLILCSITMFVIFILN